MAQNVWTLSVDLQTKTAAFTTGLSDAAKSARGSFSEIKDGAREMGSETGYSMTEARHGVMLLGEEFGIHIPRALTSFIASLGPIGGAMEAAFPFLAIIVGATLLLEHLSKLREEGAKLTESQVQFGTSVSNVLSGLDAKLLEAGIRTDELNHNHLGALNKQLELIDHQSMNELVQAFGVVSKAADLTFAQLKTSWYQWGAGSAGAKAALENFKTEYDSLLAQGKDKEANDLLAGTLKSAQRVLDLQNQAKSNQMVTGTHGTTQKGDYNKFEEAKLALQKQGIAFSDKEVEAQNTLVGALQAQVNVEGKIAELKAAQKGNAVHVERNEENKDATKEFEQQQRGLAEYVRHREEAENRLSALRRKATQEEEAAGEAKLHADDAFLKVMKEEETERAKLAQQAGKENAGYDTRMADLQLAADKEAGQMRMAQSRMTAAQIADMEMGFAAQEYNAKQKALHDELAALDQYAADYQNKKQALNNKLLELDKQFQNQDQALEDQAQKKTLSNLQSAEARMRAAYAQGFSQVLMGKESFGKMMQSVDSQIIGSMMQTAIMSMLTLDMTKEKEAASAARKAFLWGWEHGGPAAPVLAPALGVAAFAASMAFHEGGMVPGYGTGDIVPARLEPGETVLTKKLTDGLTRQAQSGGPGGDVHMHHHATYNVQAFDSTGVDKVLQDHGEKFMQHATRELRKMNR